MFKPIVSIIVCTYNRSDLLKDALQSFTDQTSDKARYEVIVVDNNSCDNTEEVVRTFIERQKNFLYVKEPKQGLSHARNRGYMEARGKYVAYIDDDARAESSWVENIIDFTSRHPEIAAFGGPYKGFSLVEVPKWYKDSYGSWTLGEKEKQICQNEWINGTNMIYERSLLKNFGGFNPKIGMAGKKMSYGEETNLLIKIKEKNLPIYYVPDIVVEHLVADYKMSFMWMLKSDYMNGLSGLETFGLQRRPLRQLSVTLYLFLYGIARFILSKERHLKARVLESFSIFVIRHCKIYTQ
jgi:glycosyltransferase involved in cell wall biosynthesis